MAKSRCALNLIVVLVLSVLCLLVGLAFIRALPGRYAYYLPEPLQALLHLSLDLLQGHLYDSFLGVI